MTKTDLIIIGSGSAGLMARSLFPFSSITFEKNESAGRKLLLTGGGRCNLTHSGSPEELSNHYYEGKMFVRSALNAFPPEKIRSYFSSLGLKTYEDEKGRIYPITDDAKSVCDALLSGKRSEILFSSPPEEIEKVEDGFLLRCKGKEYFSKFLIFAAGGKAFPKTGSDGSAFSLLKTLGHTCTPLSPALAPITLSSNPFSSLSGISVNAELKMGKIKKEGELLFTRKGISGPLAENFSRYVPDISEFEISFIPDLDKEKIARSKSLLKNTLPLPLRLTETLFPFLAGKQASTLKREEYEEISKKLRSFKVRGKAEERGAMSTKGGISTTEIKRNTMESRIVENLYITGDAVDVDAECGGYSLTFAFASSFLAVQDILNKIDLL